MLHLLTLGLALLVASPASGNRLVNGGFDGDLSGWSGSGTLSDFDFTADPTSRSVLLASGESLAQCVDVAPGDAGATVDASLLVFLPSPQPTVGQLFPTLTFFDQEACGGPGFNLPLGVFLIPPDEFVEIAPLSLPTVPDGARSALFALGFRSPPVDGVSAFFDEATLVFLPEPGVACLVVGALAAFGWLPARRRLP